VLRQRARAAGVAAFSVLDLLTELSQDDASPTAADRERTWRELASQYVTDLPIGADTITALAGDWRPGPAHTAIARPGWWQHHAATWMVEWLSIATAAAKSGNPENLTQITLAALTGALQAVTPGRCTQRYQQLAAITFIACHDARAQAPPACSKKWPTTQVPPSRHAPDTSSARSSPGYAAGLGPATRSASQPHCCQASRRRDRTGRRGRTRADWQIEPQDDIEASPPSGRPVSTQHVVSPVECARQHGYGKWTAREVDLALFTHGQHRGFPRPRPWK